MTALQASEQSAGRHTHLVLVGLMGSGKTTTGEICARHLGRAFVDTDEVVESLTGVGVSEIFGGAGEGEFRALERQAVADVLASPAPLVAACGGGAVLDAENRKAMRRSGFVVWLDAPAEVLAARVCGADGGVARRPLLAAASSDQRGVLATLERLGDLRRDAYKAASEAVVQTAGRSPDQVADEVVERFRARQAGS